MVMALYNEAPKLSRSLQAEKRNAFIGGKP
jgi:hypothetical protein